MKALALGLVAYTAIYAAGVTTFAAAPVTPEAWTRCTAPAA